MEKRVPQDGKNENSAKTEKGNNSVKRSEYSEDTEENPATSNLLTSETAPKPNDMSDGGKTEKIK